MRILHSTNFNFNVVWKRNLVNDKETHAWCGLVFTISSLNCKQNDDYEQSSFSLMQCRLAQLSDDENLSCKIQASSD